MGDPVSKGLRRKADRRGSPWRRKRSSRIPLGSKAAWVVDAWTGCWLDPAFPTWSLAPVLPRVVCPVLALHGASDEYGSDLHPAMIVRTHPIKLPDAPIHVFRHAKVNREPVNQWLRSIVFELFGSDQPSAGK
jgi:hypothetical protein